MAVKKQSRSKTKPRVSRSVRQAKPAVRARAAATTKPTATMTPKPMQPVELPLDDATGQSDARWWTGAPAILGAALCVLVALAFVGSPSSDRIEGATAQADAELEAALAPVRKDPAPSKSAAKPAAKAAATTGSREKNVPDPDPDPGLDAVPVHEAAAVPSMVTITGCLERSDDAFRLTDTTGADAPTSRSWKSGFLKRRPAAIDVLDPAKQLNLSGHVGQRVTVTGTLEDREMRGRSLHRVASSCESKPTAKI